MGRALRTTAIIGTCLLSASAAAPAEVEQLTVEVLVTGPTKSDSSRQSQRRRSADPSSLQFLLPNAAAEYSSEPRCKVQL
jgi:hypothetical protein